MAVSLPRRYTLSNPGKKRKRVGAFKTKAQKLMRSPFWKGAAKKKKNPSAKRKMSPKQIAIFGTPRQKAALRASKARKRSNPSKKRVSVASYFNRKSTKKYNSKTGAQHLAPKKRAKRRKNVGEIVSISLAGLAGNPGRRKKTMARRRKRNSGTKVGRSWSTYSSKKRKKNPGVRRRRRSAQHRATSYRRRSKRTNSMYRVRRVRHARRHNAGGIGGVTTGIVGKALGVIGGAVASKYLTQLVLQGNNMGWMGYAGNAAASVALGWAASKVTKSREFGASVLVGGLAATILRILQDKTSIGNYVNLSLSGAGKGGDIGIGIITDSSFFNPQVAQPGSMTSFITPRATRDYVSSQVAQMATMAKAGSPGKSMGMVGRRTRAVM